MKGTLHEEYVTWRVRYMKGTLHEGYVIWRVRYMKCTLYEVYLIWRVRYMKSTLHELYVIWRVRYMKGTLYEGLYTFMLNCWILPTMWNVSFVSLEIIKANILHSITCFIRNSYSLWDHRHHHHHHNHHVPEGLGVCPVPWSSRWSWSLHLFLGRPIFLRPFGLYCSACFGSLFVSILCTCCSHFWQSVCVHPLNML